MKKLFTISFSILLTCHLFAQKWIPHTFQELGNKVGYIDSATGETTVFWHFDSAKDFRFGLATACYQGKWGCFNAKGEVVVPFVFKYLNLVNDTFANVDYNKGWSNEKYFIKGKLGNQLYCFSEVYDPNANLTFFDYIPISDSPIPKITIIDSDIKKKALLIYRDEFVLNEIRMNAYPQPLKKNPKFWNAFQINFIQLSNSGTVKKSNFIELKTGMYYQNKFMLTGLSIAYQSIRQYKDSLKFKVIQMPIYWTNYLFLNRNLNGTKPYFRLDFGYVLGEYAYSGYRKNAKPGTPIKIQKTNSSNILLNIGVGCKLGDKNYKSGFTIETGYKFAPISIANVTYFNHFYISFGALL